MEMLVIAMLSYTASEVTIVLMTFLEKYSSSNCLTTFWTLPEPEPNRCFQVTGVSVTNRVMDMVSGFRTMVSLTLNPFFR